MKLLAKSGSTVLAEFQLHSGAMLTLGASRDADLTVEGENCLSRLHAKLHVFDGQVTVESLPTAKNPIFVHGTPREHFELKAGDFFVIGSTCFQLVDALAAATPEPSVPGEPIFRFSIPTEELRTKGSRRDRMRLLDLMELPDVLRTRSRSEFYAFACGLLRLTSGAIWVRILCVDGESNTVLAEDAAEDVAKPKHVSRSLIQAAITEAPKPVTYCWRYPVTDTLSATATEGVDWAVCCAMQIPGEPPVVFYVAGSANAPGGEFSLDSATGAKSFLHDTSRLVGLLADMIGRTMSLHKVETWHTRLNRFFPPKLVTKILESDPGAPGLAPRITEATIMFFDIRGFSLMTEGSLQRMLEYEGDLRRVLTAMTQCVLDQDGIVLRYMGDGLLACWNVPYPVQDHVARAATAALRMVTSMGHVMKDWACGIGIGVGEVVAGSLGSEQVYAYDILGAVANQTARVEGITKIVEVPILVTDAVARRVPNTIALTRRVARFRPSGMETTLDLFTLERLPTEENELATMRQRLDLHAAGLEAFEKGDWKQAFHILHPIVELDAAARFVYKRALAGAPPRDWEGVVELTSK
ncbi:MAG: adenylate/guanylate cyclase domain-containing protein [Planctomycetota bacterium]